jgi:hypothetical protein
MDKDDTDCTIFPPQSTAILCGEKLSQALSVVMDRLQVQIRFKSVSLIKPAGYENPGLTKNTLQLKSNYLLIISPLITVYSNNG